MQLLARQQWDSLPINLNTNSRSDTFDILHYALSMDFTKPQWLQASCTLTVQPLQAGVQTLPLDLLRLQVDSVKQAGQQLSYRYNDTLLRIHFPVPLVPNTSVEVTVYYQGRPQSDAQWGGFLYEKDYAYNLGVGFAANPHSYGRVWHPCMDNFRERATYTFEMTTQAPQVAHCNGRLVQEVKRGNRITRLWRQPEPIPTYLAAIAIAPYTVLKSDYIGIADTIPIRLVAEPADTAKLQASFVHLPDAIAAYEYWYGPHRWSKVGYSLVPFRSGAMEHASNIAYPRFAANGTVDRERLMAHELGHSWWGNLVTCANAQDMWINEGMATYSEHLFVEWVYGKAAYRKAVQDNHYLVLRQAHLREKGYRPITGVPHQYTYGIHVYKKGASVAHNLRWYLGDAAFRKGLQHITDSFAYQNINAAQLRDALSRYTNKDMRPFFDDWVFQGGFPHFDVIDWSSIPQTEGHQLSLIIEQQLVGRQSYCQQVPLPLTIWDATGQRYQTTIVVSDSLDTLQLTVPIKPHRLLLNQGHQLNQARYDEQLLLDSSQLGTMVPLTRNVLQWQDLTLRHIEDTALLYIQRHPVPAHTSQLPAGYALDQTGYWSVQSTAPGGYEAVATLRPKGTYFPEPAEKSATVLLYRAHPAAPWQLHPSYVLGKWLGAEVLVFTVLEGDYVVAKGQAASHSQEAKQWQAPSWLQQTPQDNHWEVDWGFNNSVKVQLLLYDKKGKLMYQSNERASNGVEHITCSLEKGGPYFLKWVNGQGKVVHAQMLRPMVKE